MYSSIQTRHFQFRHLSHLPTRITEPWFQWLPPVQCTQVPVLIPVPVPASISVSVPVQVPELTSVPVPVFGSCTNSCASFCCSSHKHKCLCLKFKTQCAILCFQVITTSKRRPKNCCFVCLRSWGSDGPTADRMQELWDARLQRYLGKSNTAYSATCSR